MAKIFLSALESLVYGRLDMYVSAHYAQQLNFPVAGIFSIGCSCIVSNRQGTFTI